MTKLHSFKDNKKNCYANVRMDNGDPIFISVAQTGVLVKKSKLGILGPKLYESRTVHDAAMTAQALDVLYPDYVGIEGMNNPALRAFTNAALHCSTTAEMTRVLNSAIDDSGGSQGDRSKPGWLRVAEELDIASNAIIADYADLMIKVSDEDAQNYPAGVFPESLLIPIAKSALTRLLEIELEAEASSESDKGLVLETALVLLDCFIEDAEAGELNSARLRSE